MMLSLAKFMRSPRVTHRACVGLSRRGEEVAGRRTVQAPIDRRFPLFDQPRIRLRERTRAAKIVETVERRGVAAFDHEVLAPVDERRALAGRPAPEQEGD